MYYKINLNQIRTFLEIGFLGIVLHHDSYHAFLAIVSAMLAYFLTLSIFSSKFWRFTMFTILAVTFCQLSVTVKKAVMDVGFRQIALEKPFGVLFADAVYGFKAIFVIVGKFWGSMYEAIGLNEYSSLESLNYRFLTLLMMMIVLWAFMLKKPEIKKVKLPPETAPQTA